MSISPLQELALRTATPTKDRLEESLGRDGFLRMFIAQLENQDPLDPQDATQLSAQLAQFSQLEQALQSTAALGKIAEKLDALIELGRSSEARIDPVSLVGRTVELQDDTLLAPPAGLSSELELGLPEGIATLALEIRDADGEPLGRAELAPAEGGPLPAGNYALYFEGGTARLREPGGAVQPLTFQSLVLRENGERSIDPDRTLTLATGRRYGFAASHVREGGEVSPLPLLWTGTVTSVRLVDGAPLISVGGREVDPARVIRIW
jgi:flagellar basal-body rod modification protein FlgD